MFNTYYNSVDGRVTDKQHKRIVAMQAALEIAKASAGATTSYANGRKVEYDLKFAAQEISTLADAIQSYMDAN